VIKFFLAYIEDEVEHARRYGYAGQLPSCAFPRRILSMGFPGKLARRIVCLPAYSLQG
jgi:hypothetical protein